MGVVQDFQGVLPMPATWLQSLVEACQALSECGTFGCRFGTYRQVLVGFVQLFRIFVFDLFCFQPLVSLHSFTSHLEYLSKFIQWFRESQGAQDSIG